MADTRVDYYGSSRSYRLEEFRERTFLVFEKGHASRWYELLIKGCIVTAIVLSLCTIVAETVDTACVTASRMQPARPRWPVDNLPWGAGLRPRHDRGDAVFPPKWVISPSLQGQ